MPTGLQAGMPVKRRAYGELKFTGRVSYEGRLA